MEDILYDETETIDFIYNGLNDEAKTLGTQREQKWLQKDQADRHAAAF